MCTDDEEQLDCEPYSEYLRVFQNKLKELAGILDDVYHLSESYRINEKLSDMGRMSVFLSLSLFFMIIVASWNFIQLNLSLMYLNQLHLWVNNCICTAAILVYFKFQSKVDNIGMYHAVAKDIPKYKGGSDLMRNMAQYVQCKPKKFSVSMFQRLYTLNYSNNQIVLYVHGSNIEENHQGASCITFCSDDLHMVLLCAHVFFHTENRISLL